jgi:hypothetical protein
MPLLRSEGQIISTLLLSDNMTWTATPMPGYQFLVQDSDAIFGILGTRAQFHTMISRIDAALLSVKERLV